MAAVATLTVLAPATTATAAPTDDSKTAQVWNPTLLSSEPLHDGSAVRLHYTDGITVVASTGAKVIFKGSGRPVTTVDGRRVYDCAVWVADPDAPGKSSM